MEAQDIDIRKEYISTFVRSASEQHTFNKVEATSKLDQYTLCCNIDSAWLTQPATCTHLVSLPASLTAADRYESSVIQDQTVLRRFTLRLNLRTTDPLQKKTWRMVRALY